MIRFKHILIPIVAVAMWGSYFSYAKEQAARFDPEVWQTTVEKRADMVAPLMGYVLKVGQSRQDVKDMLGEQLIGLRWTSCCGGGLFCEANAIQETYEVSDDLSLTIIYSVKEKVTDFYIDGQQHLFIF